MEEDNVAMAPSSPALDVEDSVPRLRHSAEEPVPVPDVVKERLQVRVLQSRFETLELDVVA